MLANLFVNHTTKESHQDESESWSIWETSEQTIFREVCSLA